MTGRASILAGILLLLAQSVAAKSAIWREPVTGMAFVALPKGCFRMGSVDAHPIRGSLQLARTGFAGSLAADELPRHEVCLDRFWIGQFEVRADEWQLVMGMPPPSGHGPQPASGLTWDAAQAFAARLTELAGGRDSFRLPTEAEWEYACRAGSRSNDVPLGVQRSDAAWYNHSPAAPRLPQPVGQLKANAWRVHDMLGNVWEWVADAYVADAYRNHVLFSPVVSNGGEVRVLRGASVRSEPMQVRCATRASYPRDESLPQIGLRLVRIPLRLGAAR